MVPGLPHHIVQRGNNRQDVFFADDDRNAYLKTLSIQSSKCGLDVLGYCLMTNHVYLMVRPLSEKALAEAIGRTHFLYSQYINRMHGRSGHLWQGRFYSGVLEPGHFLTALRYVERNPVRARIVRRAWRYPWSSAAFHTDTTMSSDPIALTPWRDMVEPTKWKDRLIEPEDRELLATFRRNTCSGRPLGTDSFLSKLEHKLNRRLRPLPVGRPRKRRTVRKKIGDCP